MRRAVTSQPAPTPLLGVEDAVPARGRDVHLKPRLATPPAERAFVVRLVRPDGTAREANAVIDVSHVRGPMPPFAMVRLLDLAPEDVPPGTEVYVVTAPRTGAGSSG